MSANGANGDQPGIVVNVPALPDDAPFKIPAEAVEPEHVTTAPLSLLKPESNVPENDQRPHLSLADERFIEMLARCPKGLQKDVSAVMLYLKGCQDELARLSRMEKMKPDKRGNVRVLKDTTNYFVRHLKPCTTPGCASWEPATKLFTLKGTCNPHVPATHPVAKRRTFFEAFFGKPKHNPIIDPEHFVIEERTVGIYTVLPAIQIPHYRRKIERQTAQGLDWVWREMRLWIGEDGKGRTEMIDALQASNGRFLPPENGGMPMIFNMQGGNPPTPPKVGGFRR